MRAKRIYVAGAFVGLLFVILSSVAFGQKDTTGVAENPKIFPHGKWGLQAQLGNPFLNRKSARFDLLFKYHTSANTAWRIGADLTGSYFWANGGATGFSYSDSGTVIDSSINEYDADNRRSSIDFTIQRLKYVAPNEQIGLYWGLGPEIVYQHYRDKSNTHDIDDPAYPRTGYRTGKTYGGGLIGTIGAEYFPLKRISFAAEYFISALYTRQSYETELTSKGTGSYSLLDDDRNMLTFSANNIEFGMTVYF